VRLPSRRPTARPWLLLALVLAVAPAGRALGQPPGAAPGLAGPPLAARFALPNGIVVLVAERPGLPIVALRAGVGAGAVLDPPDRPGLANLTALLLTRGTATRTGPEIDRASSLSAEPGGGGRDWAASPSVSEGPPGLDLLADVLGWPTFPGRGRAAAGESGVDPAAEDPGTVAAGL
jgi:zinc protease